MVVFITVSQASSSIRRSWLARPPWRYSCPLNVYNNYVIGARMYFIDCLCCVSATPKIHIVTSYILVCNEKTHGLVLKTRVFVFSIPYIGQISAYEAVFVGVKKFLR